MTEAYILSCVGSNWNLEGSIKKLAGFEDLNYYFKTTKGDSFLIKIYVGAFDDIIDFHIKALNHINKTKSQGELLVPSIIPTLDGREYFEFTLDNQDYVLRIHSWVPGKLWVDYSPKSPLLLRDLGRKAGRLLNAFEGFNHSSMVNRDFEWDLVNSLWVEEHLDLLDPHIRGIIETFIKRFKSFQRAHMDFPKMVIHNDINDYNILVNDGNVSGVIDFGDMCYTQRVNDLAILLAYGMMDQNNPLDAAAEIIKGYSEIVELSKQEIDSLFTLSAMRLSVSVVSAAINLDKNPENEYLQVTSAPGREVLTKIGSINADFAKSKFRDSAGLDVIEIRSQFDHWISKNRDSFSSVCPLEIGSDDYYFLDFSVGSTELGHENYYNNPEEHEQLINKILKENKKSYGIGKYNEVRPLYSSNDFTEVGNEGNRWRTVHIGLDFFHKAGTDVYAFADGEVDGLKYNSGDKNYGNTVVLKHVFDNNVFYTLYGHLSSKSLEHLQKSQKVSKGELIGWFGQPHENGNWAPHLHFQIFLNKLGFEGDFPGVCYLHERKIFTQLSPEPTAFFGLISTPKNKLDAKEILLKRKSSLGRSYSISYKDHLHIERAHMQFLYDQNGRKYLDCVNNVPHVGHQNIRVIEAARKQMALLNTNTRYLHENIVVLADALLSKLPDQLKVCHFVNSGTEANELAIRMARVATGKNDVIAMEHGYHGNSNLCVDISSYKFDGKGGAGKKDYVHILNMPDKFRGNFRGDDLSKLYSKQAIEHIDQIIKTKDTPAALICESILSCGGQICFPEGYLKSIYEALQARGIRVIADEVQVGIGRVGSHMWAFEKEGVSPDIVTIGKPFGNGHPLGAVVCTEEVAEKFANGMEYFNTFGGNPVSCAIGLEVLKIVEDEDLMNNALEVGNYIKKRFTELKSKHPIIGDVRGHGFFLGWEFVMDENFIPAAEQASYFVNRAKEYGILLSTDGPLHNVIKFKPPMIFTKQNADYLLDYTEKILNEDFMKK